MKSSSKEIPRNSQVESTNINNAQSLAKEIRNGSDVFSALSHEQINEAINIMKTRLPRSAHVYNMAKMASKFPSTTVYSLNGDLSEKAIFVLKDIRQDFHQDINISVPWDLKISESVKQAFINTAIIDWNAKYLFSAVDRLISPMIVEICTIHKGNSTLINPNYYYFMGEEDAADLDIKLRPGIEVKPLNLEINGGMDLLLKGWKYTQEGTAEFLHEVVENGLTSGVFVDGVPVCGVIENRSGLLGMLFTAKDHRNKGYAQICTQYLMKQLGMNGLVAVSDAECDNTASREFHKRVGFTEIFVCDDIIFENNGFEAK